MRLIGLVLALIIAGTTAAAAKTACHTAKPSHASEHWAWRQIDGRQCWYAGQKGKDKASLYWRQTQTAAKARHQRLSAAPTFEGPAAGPTTESAMPGAGPFGGVRVVSGFNGARPHTFAPVLAFDDEDAALQASVWPDLNTLPASFEDRWRALTE